MNISTKQARPVLLALLTGAALLAALSAQAGPEPTIHKRHGIEYMSGGVGSDEAQRMEHLAAQWPATFEFAVKDGQRSAFAADVRVTVRDHSGRALLRQVLADGPFMVARLLPGRYEVEATLAGQTLKRSLELKPGTPGKILFLWPADAAAVHRAVSMHS